MEFVLKTDLEKEIPQLIVFNKNELIAELTEKTQRYINLVVTEDAIQAAKKDRAALNALKNAVENKRKEVKKQCLAPYEQFERDIKEVIAPIDSAIENIDKQVKKFESTEKEEKRAALEKYFCDNVKELESVVTFDKIFNDKWLNKTVSLMSATQDIFERLENIRRDLTTISSLKSDFELQIKARYIETLSLQDALNEHARLKNAKERLESANQIYTPAIKETTGHLPDEELRDIRALFLGTTQAFRDEMRALCKKHNITVKAI